jgi:hypothetical protein
LAQSWPLSETVDPPVVALIGDTDYAIRGKACELLSSAMANNRRGSRRSAENQKLFRKAPPKKPRRDGNLSTAAEGFAI